MNREILKYIKNKNLKITDKEKFTTIIGSEPSRGARSPILWNKCFKRLKKKVKMYPLDVEKKNLKKLLNFLKSNKNFLGGSVTVPYKENIFNLLKKNSTNEAKNISAINCIFRDKKGNLKVTNTDGEGSLLAFKKKFKNKKIEKILILGCGGAGKAVSTYFANLKEVKSLTILSRKKKDKYFANRIKSKWLEFNSILKLKYDFDLIINCTSLGFGKHQEKISLNKSYLDRLNKNTIIYDIIYKPKKTKLLEYSSKRSLKTLNGLDMNLYQAVISFSYVNKIKNMKLIKKAMNEKLYN